MRFVTYADKSGRPVAGLLDGKSVIPLAGPNGSVSLLEFVRRTSVPGADLKGVVESLRSREQALSLDRVKLLAPIPAPAKNVFCVGRNYHEHVAEGDKVYGAASGFAGTPPAPIFFTKPSTSIVGPEADVMLHRQTERLDYEIELGVIIGLGGKDISEADALDHVWGYTIINDVTARDLQDHHKQWFKGKSMDTFCPMGPWLVYRDEIQDPHNLDIELRVNGEVRQKANTRQMIFDIRRIIAELSAGLTLEPGDIIATGTCSGCAFAMDPPAWLQPGDVMELDIEGIGTLRNTVRQPVYAGAA